jgi:hypothetical protein
LAVIQGAKKKRERERGRRREGESERESAKREGGEQELTTAVGCSCKKLFTVKPDARDFPR